MSAVAQNDRWDQSSEEAELSFLPADYDLTSPDAEKQDRRVCWRVVVCPDGHMITRQVLRDEELQSEPRALGRQPGRVPAIRLLRTIGSGNLPPSIVPLDVGHGH
jgi:hypothetical protein